MKMKTFFIVLRYGVDSLCILAFSLTQGIYQKLHEDDDSENMQIRVCVPIVCGLIIFLMAQIKVIIYIRVILKMDLSSQQNLIKKGIDFFDIDQIHSFIFFFIYLFF